MATVTYKIGGKFDGRQINKQKGGINSLGKVGKKISSVMKGFVQVFQAKKIYDFQKQCNEAYSIQEKALTKLSQSVANNQKLTENSLKNIIAYTGKLQSKSIYGDEALQDQQQFLAGLGKNETEIKKVLNAQVELSSSGIGDLQSNVKNLTKSLNGQKSELNRIIPEMDNLTEQQLRNGEAIDIVQDKYKGFAERMATTTLQGQTQQASNLMGDIKEKLGSVTSQIKFEGLKKIIPILEKINNFLSRHINKIINVLLNLPQVAKIVFVGIKEMLVKLFTVDGIIAFVKTATNIVITHLKNSIKQAVQLFNIIGQLIWQPLKTGFEIMIYGIKVSFVQVVNFFIKGINKITDAMPNWVKNKTGIKDITVIPKPTKPLPMNTKKIEDAFVTFGKLYKNGLLETKKQFSKGQKDIGKVIEKPLKDMNEKLKPILNKKRKNAQNGEIEYYGNDQTKNKGGNDQTKNKAGDSQPQEEKASNFLKILKQIIGQFGELGQVILLIMASNPIGILVQFIGKLVGQLSQSSEAFNKVINVISTVAKVVATILQPVIDQIFTPLANALQIIGEIIGNVLLPVFELLGMILIPIFDVLNVILQALQPLLKMAQIIFSIIMQFSPVFRVLIPLLNLFANAIKFLYNYILVPVVNFLLRIVQAIGNFFIGMYNKITGVLNSINIFGWHPFNFSKKRYIDYDAMKLKRIEDTPQQTGGNSSSNSSSNTSSNSSGQSYTAQKDVTVNIYYSHSYINGDAREIALNLRDEIASAERLGY